MTDKFKTITFTTKNKREFNKMKKKLDKAKNIDIIKINNEKVEICSEDDIFKLVGNYKKNDEHKSPSKNKITKKIQKPKFIKLDDLKNNQVKLKNFPISPKKHKINQKNTKPTNKNIKNIKNIKNKYKIPKKITKNNYNIRNNIKTIHHFNTILLKNFNNLSAKTIQYYFKGHNIKITNKAPKKFYKNLSKILSINTNHNINIL